MPVTGRIRHRICWNICPDGGGGSLLKEAGQGAITGVVVDAVKTDNSQKGTTPLDESFPDSYRGVGLCKLSSDRILFPDTRSCDEEAFAMSLPDKRGGSTINDDGSSWL